MRLHHIADTGFQAVDCAGLIGDRYSQLPFSLRVMAENAARHEEDAEALVANRQGEPVPFRPHRLLLQDMLGLPLLVDIMAMRSLVSEAGGDPNAIDMSLPVDLVIDHALTVQHWASKFALQRNLEREFEINHERFAFLKACEARFKNLRVFPPGGGIMHQINLEHLASCVAIDHRNPRLLVPDTVLGTDSHTPMINGLGVLGWGIGGLEGEAILFGEAARVNVPKVVGLELSGQLDPSLSATDIALTVAERLRAVGVVDCFVEMFGEAYDKLDVAGRATIANMAPEYGATAVFCPIDANTIRYLRETGRTAEHIARVEAYARTQGLWVEALDSRIDFDQVITLDLSRIGRSVSGPSRPEQRMHVSDAPRRLAQAAPKPRAERVPVDGREHTLGDGDVIIAAITSCTNTANPRAMIQAGLLARNAVARGLRTPPHVKTSLAPGSRVVARYLEKSGLQEPLNELGFHIAAFACSTCNGMSGPLAPEHEAAIRDHDLACVAVLSGNRNFAGRIHPLASRNLLASPPLVVAYALAGTIHEDITQATLGHDPNGQSLSLADIWPDAEEVEATLAAHLSADDFASSYAGIAKVSDGWNGLATQTDQHQWPESTYVTWPRYLRDLSGERTMAIKLTGLRPLVILGDSVTTDHISPSGAILPESAAGRFLIGKGVSRDAFNSYGTRRGSSDIVIRSTFANVRLRNDMTPDHEGSWTRIEPEGEVVSVFDAIERYAARGQQLLVVAGKNYGCGSSRDTAAKAPWLAGVRAVVAESFERIHRSNLVNMGIVPLQFHQGTNRQTLGLDGSELFDVMLAEDLCVATVTIWRRDGSHQDVAVDVRIYNDNERDTFRQGGLLPRVYRGFIAAAA